MSYTGLLASVTDRIESACMQMVENTGPRMEDFACRLGGQWPGCMAACEEEIEIHSLIVGGRNPCTKRRFCGV